MTRFARWSLPFYWIALAVATHWPGLEIYDPDELPVVLQPDKALHVVCFALLTAWLIAAKPFGYRLSFNLTAILSTIIIAGYACLDEYTQKWVGRVVGVEDLTASLIGVLGTYLVMVGGCPRERFPAVVVHTLRAVVLLMVPSIIAMALTPSGNPRLVSLMRPYITPYYGVDKDLHFWLAGLLTLLLAGAACAGRHRPRLSALLTLVIAGLSAPIVELVQRPFGRGYEIMDVYRHEQGVLLAVIIWAVLAAVFLLIPKRDRQAAEPGDATHHDHRFVGQAVLVGSLTFVSRLSGLARDAVLAGAMGLGAAADAFFIGFLIPNLFRRLFGEGALTAAFVPHYTRLIREDPLIARRFATLVVALLISLLSALTLVGEAVLWWVASMQWSEETSLALRLTMLMLPYMPLICLVALLGGVLQVHGRFGPPATAPILLNLTMIGFAAAAGIAFGGGELTQLSMMVGVGVLFAGVLQVLWQLSALRTITGPSLTFAGTRVHLRSMLIMWLPMIFGLAVLQINTLLDTAIAFGLSPKGEGDTFSIFGWTAHFPIAPDAVGALWYAQRLYQFPLGVFGIAIATAIFPALAHAADDAKRFGNILHRGLRLAMFIALPAAVGLLMVRLPITRTIFERGRFDIDNSVWVSTILIGYAAGIWAYSLNQVLTRAFYAMGDAKTPLRISVGMVIFNLLLNLVLIWPLGAAGLAWSTAISAAGQTVLLIYCLQRHVGQPIDSAVLRSWGVTALQTIVMVAALIGFNLSFDFAQIGQSEAAILMATMVIIGGAVIVGGAILFRRDEATWLLKRKLPNDETL